RDGDVVSDAVLPRQIEVFAEGTRPLGRAGCAARRARRLRGSARRGRVKARALRARRASRRLRKEGLVRVKTVTPLSVSYLEPNDNNSIRYLTFCRVEADDGTVGWGEAMTQFPGSTRATERLVEE